jgi:hypothetical protein
MNSPKRRNVRSLVGGASACQETCVVKESAALLDSFIPPNGVLALSEPAEAFSSRVHETNAKL